MLDQYAVFGNPIKHSYSPIIHKEFALQTRQKLVYERQLVNIGDFAASVDEFFLNGGCGLNVTLPFKTEAHDYADRLTDRALMAGAVNTLSRTLDGNILGDNSDGFGLVTDIKNNLGWTIRSKRVLVMGAGGAVRGILGPLSREQPGSLVIVNRTVTTAMDLVEALPDELEISVCSYDDLHERSFDLIINGTSASLFGKELRLPDMLLSSSDTACYDMMYGRHSSAFMGWADKRGADVSDGLGMLVEQAAESFSIWRGIRPNTQPVINLLREKLNIARG